MLGNGRQLHLIAVYPRRPKLSVNNEISIMKVNAELFDAAAAFRHVGVSVFVAFPHIASIFDFTEEVDFSWFTFNANETERDVEVEFKSGISIPPVSDLLRGPHNDADVCRIVREQSCPQLWDGVIEALNHVRHQQIARGRWSLPFTRDYKPTYFLAW
jgi:hypothetical protein